VARRMIIAVGLIAASLWTAACTETRPLGSVTTTGAGGMGGSAAAGPIQVLVWNNALKYGHVSRVQAIAYLKMRESSDNIMFDTTYAHTNPNVQEQVSDTTFDASVFTDQGLDKYDVVLFLNTTGNTLDDGMKAVRRQALQDFIEKKGRGFVGIHSATDTYQKNDPDPWPWYVDFIGTNWVGQEPVGTPGVAQFFQNMTHPILIDAMTPNPWSRSDEWFNFSREPQYSQIPGVKLLLTAHDQASATERASAWIHEMPAGGRLFYTAFGHATSTFTEPLVINLIVAGIKWAAGRL